ncbi:hypothetical protein [Methanoregula sp.]|uniref:hypothetical protein n=1 Tax=Methanoregula sp. TaxID=2052170 RepID=UPI002BEF31DC|nr:hypothetical protein [Methanoregula sp.]HVP97454.1 hypothetical protein [Methanoregula sp.]
MIQHHNKSRLSLILRHLSSDFGLVIIVLLVFLAVYLVDIVTPLGNPVWLLYFIPLILAYWSTRYYAIPAVCIVTLLFLICGFLFSPSGIAVNLAVAYRFTFFVVFISVSLVLWIKRGL